MSSVINVRLNEKMTLRFVELYRDQRLLWDKEHEAYNKRTDRLRAYRRIADGMAVDGLGVPEVASKIKNIRSTYLQELKKIKDSAHRHLVLSEEDGDAASPYVPKLAWFPIIDSMIGGAAVKRLYSSPSTAEMLSIDYAEDEEGYSSYSYADNGGDATVSTGKRHHPHQSHHLHEPPDDSPPPPAKRFVYEKQQSSIELFSKYMATSLETLQPRQAVRAQKEMHDVLVKYKLMEFEDQ
ncbi:MADF domain [Cinara cedri]|uniref:MADF domain n=1 Tax=Cinara cedri TaxID=506608 RepID=A0A5E4NGS4_9HEMI|nr:MADF domain [Cinara cedri]